MSPDVSSHLVALKYKKIPLFKPIGFSIATYVQSSPLIINNYKTTYFSGCYGALKKLLPWSRYLV